jgi:hypothetical protein
MRTVRDDQSVELDERKAVPIDLNTGRDFLLRLWAGDEQYTHDDRSQSKRDNHKAPKNLGSSRRSSRGKPIVRHRWHRSRFVLECHYGIYPPWKLDESAESFCIRDAKGQALAYVYYEDETGRRMAMGRLTKDEARRIAVTALYVHRQPFLNCYGNRK